MEKKTFPGDAAVPQWISGSKNMKWRTTRKSTIELDTALTAPRTRGSRIMSTMIAESIQVQEVDCISAVIYILQV